MTKVMVVDDEPLARQAIILLLQQQGEFFTRILESADGIHALELFEQESPDILFLDIKIPGINGLELAERLGGRCVIVFVTAYDEFAVQAFEANATDYLLKPYDDERFYLALDKAREKLANRQLSYFHRLMNMPNVPKISSYKSRLVIRDPGRIRLVDVESVDYFLGAGNYAEVHLKDGKQLLHRETLTSLEKQLDPELFIRIHRSCIVRQDRIVELRPNEKGDYTVILRGGQELTLSRRNKHKLAELLD
ncbi:LytTR family DNA-binding domain-containing protein [Bowmanella denitrificans]|uniref:LytTR family DNA-binding domain-containing protein n=1 Tax=Bowmanella denitrificans TaxID=366582 RepID=A0ABN0XE85_9ALTE